MNRTRLPDPFDIPEEDQHPLGGRRCDAHKKDGQRCQKKAMLGQRVCGSHGGRSKRAKEAGLRRVQEEHARIATERFGLPQDISPSEALLEEVKWTAGHVRYLRSKVQELDEDMLTFGVDTVKSDDQGKTERILRSKVDVWYELYLRERKHLVEVSKAAVLAGVEQRRVELAEQQGQIVAGVVRRILDGMLQELTLAGYDVQAQWDSLTREIVPREFRALELGAS